MRKIIYLIIIFWLLIATTSGCNKKSDNTMRPQNISAARNIVIKNEFSGAVFEKNDNIYLYNGQSGNIKSIGESSMSKTLLKLSPDRKKVAFKYFSISGV